MALTRERKEELVAQYGEMLQNCGGLIFTEYRGLTVTNVDDLRAKLREVDGTYVITKNTLLKIALEQQGWPVPEALLLGPVAIAFSNGDFPGVAKALLDFGKDFEEILVVKGGIMEGAVMDAAQVTVISKLPSLDELRAQLAGLLVQPATGLVSLLNAATGQLVNVLDAYVQENSGEEAA